MTKLKPYVVGVERVKKINEINGALNGVFNAVTAIVSIIDMTYPMISITSTKFITHHIRFFNIPVSHCFCSCVTRHSYI